ncbi:MAG: hypothetical protein CM15mP55_0080 [Hyphomicrobiales bacterium]|nr:MAG: hypothetical protein CM15mP55_0080 [Hyphomicrobiales bacterium]
MNFLGYSWVDQGIYLKEGRGFSTGFPKRGQTAFFWTLGWAHSGGRGMKGAGVSEHALLRLGPTVGNRHLGDVLWRLGGRGKRVSMAQGRPLIRWEDRENRKKLVTGLGAIPKFSRETLEGQKLNAEKLMITAPAKVNLSLRITGRRRRIS